MERVQRIGLIALVVLLGIAAAGLILGPRLKGSDDDTTRMATLDSGAMPKTSLLPPDTRSVTPASFAADPVRHPIQGGNGPGANEYASTDYSKLARENSYGASTPPSAPAGERTVRVREGDTLEKIARRELGSGGRWQEIAQQNGISDPRRIRVGQVLALPGGGAAATEPAGASAAAGAERSYTVQSGDTLSRISQQVYGSSRHWQQIQEFNGIADARSLKVGQVLRIPELAQ